ncbi:MAG: hypothetical protein WC948_04575, partial [Thermovirgaceae bacterium]
ILPWEKIIIETQRKTNCCEGQEQNPRPRQTLSTAENAENAENAEKTQSILWFRNQAGIESRVQGA